MDQECQVVMTALFLPPFEHHRKYTCMRVHGTLAGAKRTIGGVPCWPEDYSALAIGAGDLLAHEWHWPREPYRTDRLPGVKCDRLVKRPPTYTYFCGLLARLAIAGHLRHADPPPPVTQHTADDGR